ncbi:hypothetical protein PVAND_016739 [Polypedilum vanderplanki]|uniref:Tyrosinase copper-binding domain-containing protein n=1 Tax=Polypedilum vanderplanki TaxID=319348 RepID=A0A9J6BGP0_POLVA|nr:hypothetical protein PVAND_016739 [Polypedilum vanderplanki]
MANKKNLLLLFENPGEPVFTQKGKNHAVFELPSRFFDERYQPIGAEIQNRFSDDAGERIPVRDIQPPNLNHIGFEQLGKQDNFTLFIPKHRKLASALSDIFLKARDIDHLQSLAVYARDRVNPQLFNYALSVALLHRPDTKDLDLPLYIESFPGKFLDSRSFVQAREEATVVPQGSRRPIVIPRDYTGSDLDPEHRLWYFREDLGINLHHWHWHLVYPFEASDINIVRKDRRGELFYYMHQQIIARYNFERFSNHLSRVVPLSNIRAPIPEGYFSKLDSLVASRAWPGRISNATLSDINRRADEIQLNLSTLERWRDRFLDAIAQMAVTTSSGQRIVLDEVKGIDILGDMMESSILNPNPDYYGDLHNMLHMVLSYQHDPDHRHLESFSVIGESSVAMRDPVFYRLHQYVDDIFQQFMEKLTPYTAQQLTYPGITITGLQIQTENVKTNVLNTFWRQSDINLAKGMDFVPRGDIFARVTHLQHSPYTINIQVNNSSGASRLGMVRVFMAPKYDERGQQFSFREYRRFMIEMDKFVANLRPGQNTLKRRSIQSTLTIPYERTFRNLDARPTGSGEDAYNFCGCGWPQHMLIPKGTPQGLPCVLFVMISDYEQDRINQDLAGTCNDAAIFCGIRDRFYPDKRTMGFPFDRVNRRGAETLQTFLTPNMGIADISIVFKDYIPSSIPLN